MWENYIAKRGTLNAGLRNEWLMTRLTLQIAQALGGKATWEDLIRYHRPIEEDISPEQDQTNKIAALLGVKQVKPHGK